MSSQPVARKGQSLPLLRQTSSEASGNKVLRANLQMASHITALMASSLGPRGMSKMLVNEAGQTVVSNSGVTIMGKVPLQNPIARILREASVTTEKAVGDGTRSVVIIAGSLLSMADGLVDDGVHPTIIVEGYAKACSKMLRTLKRIAVKIPPRNRLWLTKVARSGIASKFVSNDLEMLARLSVDAILFVSQRTVDKEKIDIDYVKVEKKPGGSTEDSSLVDGILLDRQTNIASSAMPRRVKDARIVLVNKGFFEAQDFKLKIGAKVNITNPRQLKAFLDQEKRLVEGAVDKLARIGANVVMTPMNIGPIAQSHMLKLELLGVRRVTSNDMLMIKRATGGNIVSSVKDLTPGDSGFAGLIEERNLHGDKMISVAKCNNPGSVTILLRGGSETMLEEGERAIHGALARCRDIMAVPFVLLGGGAPEARGAHELRGWAKTVKGRQQLAIQAYAEALESIPLTLASNAGLNPLDAMVELRARQEKSGQSYGVDSLKRRIADMRNVDVVDPLVVKQQVIKCATEVASMILRIDNVMTTRGNKLSALKNARYSEPVGGDRPVARKSG